MTKTSELSLLGNVFKDYCGKLDALKWSVTYDDTLLPRSCCANLDSARYIGTITHWPKTLYEFQFNDASSGAVVLLETHDFDDMIDAANYIKEILENHLTQ